MSATKRGAVPALLIVDMISRMDFSDAARMAPGAVEAARRIHSLRRRFHQRGWPVVFANDNFAHWQCDFRELVAMAAAAGGAAREIADLLAPRPSDYFVLKPKHSAFLATPLTVLLAKLGVRRVLLTGMALEGCILATAIDANAREFEVAVVSDAVAGLPELKASALEVLTGAKTARRVTSRGGTAWAGGGRTAAA